jgi:polyketide biosynthesis enoyl-CoA hydratase PksI
VRSSVVTLQDLGERVVQLTLHDRDSKNSFSPAMVEDLIEAFATIRRDDRYRVVLLTGYESYFCSGGTRDGLLSLYEGRAKFTDGNFYGLALDCEIPVIAAMQGHAIGGGLVFGLFADFVIFSRESVYTTNFMQYGFTPGMGATHIVPQKLGTGLAHEMLIGARTYRGADLEKRGLPFPVLPRSEVLGHGRELAKDIADKPRAALVALKAHLVARTRAELPATIAAELALHARTFHQPEVKDRINGAFGS